jgi:hypothetical protein
MTHAALTLSTGRARRSVDLSAYLDADLEERAHLDEIAWIKQLRHAEVDGAPFRGRFTYRGDSLWWFTELYLHKRQVVLSIFRTVGALGRLIDREHPESIAIEGADRITAALARQIAAARNISFEASDPSRANPALRLAALRARARWLHVSALASRARSRPAPAGHRRPAVAAFVHRAFWQRAPSGRGVGSAAPAATGEAYIGPVLEALERRLAPDQVAYVSLGPAENFSARRWWHPLRLEETAPETAIEHFAPLDRLAGSRGVWADRRAHLRAMWRSHALRDAAMIRGCDCWTAIREELAGVALLQWPWSARAMDEAGAALDGLEPDAVVTYAEAGGWGRALVLECRRRGIPAAGLQHGFIYRHWLNYLHHADEMLPEAGNSADAGFPRPDRTLLFDDYAREHLAGPGGFPAGTLAVTGSPRLDALVAADRALTVDAIAAAAGEAGAASDSLALVVTKFREARRVLAGLIDAAARVGGVRLVIKAHPAETPDVYQPVAAGRAHVTVLPASTPLAPLLRACRAVITVNSTVALDAAVLNVPALVIGLPNNLTPFVEAGAMAGATDEDLPGALRRILYDEEFRQQLEAGRRAVLSRYRIGSDGRAAERAAEAILALRRRT